MLIQLLRSHLRPYARLIWLIVAVQAVAVLNELGIPEEKVNVHGGAVALGHAIGSSGARVLTTLLYAMKRRDAKRGIATLCLGGGGSVAAAFERVA